MQGVRGEELTDEQRNAAAWGEVLPDRGVRSGPLLVLAGAGTGKTATIAARVAHLVTHGVAPAHILLLAFSRRAAQEMTRRAGRMVAARHRADLLADGASLRMPWAGTFHSVGARLLREHARALGLDAGFTILDRSDAADLMDAQRHEMGFSATRSRFPRKDTCLAIHSRLANTGQSLDRVLFDWPWCRTWQPELAQLFAAYGERKAESGVLDYDDLLLRWSGAMEDAAVADAIRSRFDHVLVDEFQDANVVQAQILRGLSPHGDGLFVVGDAAQSIYAFRGAEVGNILGFPAWFAPPAACLALQTNFRSVQPVLDLANALMADADSTAQAPAVASPPPALQLRAARAGGTRPLLVSVRDELAQADHVVSRVLALREEGLRLQQQAVLFRSAHHSDVLEVELTRRNVPFVKHGGLRFLDSAHVRDVLSVLRWIEQPRNGVAGFRVLQLLPGFGPAHAQRGLQHISNRPLLQALATFEAPPAAQADWPAFLRMLAMIGDAHARWPQDQFPALLDWYAPLLARLHEAAQVRMSDLDQLQAVAARFGTRERFLTELALDPPQASGDLSAGAHRDEDFLNLSTVHSAKGREWDAVFVLNVTDGNFPNEYATGDPAAVQEERRLLYVAITRARDVLELIEPRAFHVTAQPRFGDRNVWGARSRFLDSRVLATLQAG